MAALTAAQVARGRATCVILKAERRREVLQNRVDRTYYSGKCSGDKRDESACADIVCNGARDVWSNLRRREQGGEHSEVHRGVWRPRRSSILRRRRAVYALWSLGQRLQEHHGHSTNEHEPTRGLRARERLN